MKRTEVHHGMRIRTIAWFLRNDFAKKLKVNCGFLLYASHYETTKGLTMLTKLHFLESLLVVGVFVIGSVHADTLAVTGSGQFTAGVTADQLAAPNAMWSLSFTLDRNPSASNTDALGFDVAFANFQYTLNGALVAVTPGEIRFATDSNSGLFTVYFGPETGFMNGQPIPIFSFEGGQAFSGLTASPTILTGNYPVSDLIYSDALNYDDEGSLANSVKISASSQPPPPAPPVTAPVPEPSSISLLLIGLIALVLRFRLHSSHMCEDSTPLVT